MKLEVVLVPILEHLMMPWNDLRKGDSCERFDAINDGYYCKTCDFFIHKTCDDDSNISLCCITNIQIVLKTIDVFF
ncbi:unnamed protein product [Arabidopsis halleri]